MKWAAATDSPLLIVMGSVQITAQGDRSCIMSLNVIWREPLDVKFAVSAVSQLSDHEHSQST